MRPRENPTTREKPRPRVIFADGLASTRFLVSRECQCNTTRDTTAGRNALSFEFHVGAFNTKATRQLFNGRLNVGTAERVIRYYSFN